MPFIIEGGNVYQTDGESRWIIGTEEKTETIRIDDQTVADVNYRFDLDEGRYIEQSRVEREEPLPPPEPTPDEKIAQLEAENHLLQQRIAQAQDDVLFILETLFS